MKLKKMVALITAGALCLGMSLTAFAAPSVTETDGKTIVEGLDGVIDADGPYTDEQKQAYEEAKAVLSDEAKVKAELEKLGYDTEGKKIVVMGVNDYNYWIPSGTNEEKQAALPEGGADIKFSLAGLEQAKDLKHGDKIYVMHYLGDGKWEVKEATVKMISGELYAEVHLDSLSPVAFLKVMSNGKLAKLDKKGNVVSTTGTNKSPKTGE